ncbi:hypothetical protein EVAR_7475_1 [Eumeta japonica]|uniref:Uncharacterized protein n=1 Tax=Eumeta variegata TaxID=151549 RepID=A0A4C1Y6L5_EUMVA|nr:hypothetical protein EVAR_7475_1 [Eumeta japonica]
MGKIINERALEDAVADDNVSATEYVIDEGNESEITMNEIIYALKHMKVGKAAGYDRVSSKMLKRSGSPANGLYQLAPPALVQLRPPPSLEFESLVNFLKAPLFRRRVNTSLSYYHRLRKSSR